MEEVVIEREREVEAALFMMNANPPPDPWMPDGEEMRRELRQGGGTREEC